MALNGEFESVSNAPGFRRNCETRPDCQYSEGFDPYTDRLSFTKPETFIPRSFLAKGVELGAAN